MADAKKPNVFVRIFTGIKKFFRELKSETKKISWPSRKQVINNTLIVLVMVLLVGAIIWICDFVFTNGISLVINLI